MSPGTLIIIAFMVALVVMSFAFAGGAVIVALPVAVVVIAAAAALDISRRRKQSQNVQDFREQAQTKETEFSERDQETLVSE